jgi:hypothetical protein
MAKIYYESDFKLTEKFAREELVGVPFRYTYYTKTKYEASWDGKDGYKNCKREKDGSITIIFNSHGLSIGKLKVRREYFIPDTDFEDGIRNEINVEDTGIWLVNGEGDDITVDTEVIPPYIYIQEIVDNTEDASPNKALSANQGKVLNERINVVITSIEVLDNGINEAFKQVNTSIIDNAKVIAEAKAELTATNKDLNETKSELVALEEVVATKADASKVAQVERDVQKNAGAISNNTARLDVLEGEGEGSVKNAVAEGIAQVVANAPKDLDTLKEVADYIASDKTKASQIETAISDLKVATQTNYGEIQQVKHDAESTLGMVLDNSRAIDKNAKDVVSNTQAINLLAEAVATKQQELTLTVLDNGNIRIGNLQGQTKDFMPATPSGDPMHEAYKLLGRTYNQNAVYNNGADTIQETLWKNLADDADYNAKWGINVIPNNATFVKTLKFKGVDREVWEFDNPLLSNRKVWAVAEYASDGTKIWDDKVYVSRGGMWSLASLGDLTNADMRKILLSPYVQPIEGSCGADMGRVVCKIGTKANVQLQQYFLNGQRSEVLLFGYAPLTNSTQSLSCKAFVPYDLFGISHNTTATAMQYCKMRCGKSVTMNVPKISARSVIYLLNKTSSTITITFPSALYDRLMDTSTTLGTELVALLETKSNITFARGE